MKRALVLVLALQGCAPEPNNFLVAHHRGNGCDENAPENSLAAFRCVARGCRDGTARCALEVDVQAVLLDSGAIDLRMLHDATTDRTAICDAPLDFNTTVDRETLASCRLRHPHGDPTSEPIPTFGQTVATVRFSPLAFFLEPKTPSDVNLRTPLLENSIALLPPELRERTVITSFNLELLEESRHIAPDIPTACFTPLGSGIGQIVGALSDGVLADVDSCLEAGHDYVFVPPNFLEGSVLIHVRSKGAKLGVFGPDTADGVRAVDHYAHGIDVVYADHPSAF